MRLRRLLQTSLLSASLVVLVPYLSHAQDGKAPQAAASGSDAAQQDGANDNESAGDSGLDSETYRQLNLFGDVFERVRSQYVEPETDEKLVQYAINGMLTSLDPHSSYMDEKDFGEMQVQTKGEFGGLGIEVTMDNGVVKVVSPIDDTPAYRGGVKAGDYITHLDGETIIGLALNEAVEKMRGKVGTSIKLTLRREGVTEPVEVTLVRDIIKIQSVKHEVLSNNIGYIRITTFNQNTDSGTRDAVKKIKAELGDKLVGYIIDLRNNPGGLLDQAISVSDDFLDKGEIVSTRGRHPEDTKRDNATPGDIADDLPIVVLINGGSASAAEIVSGALQDHRRALLLGTQSFGKGSVQTVIPLPGHGAMRLTTARYYTPSGRSIQAKGITPDIVVEPAKIEQADIQRLRESDLHGALSNPDDDKKDEGAVPAAALPGNKPEAEPDKVKTAPGKSVEKSDSEKSKDRLKDDYQLARAVDLLRGVSLYDQRQTRKTPAELQDAGASVAAESDKEESKDKQSGDTRVDDKNSRKDAPQADTPKDNKPTDDKPKVDKPTAVPPSSDR